MRARARADEGFAPQVTRLRRRRSSARAPGSGAPPGPLRKTQRAKAKTGRRPDSPPSPDDFPSRSRPPFNAGGTEGCTLLLFQLVNYRLKPLFYEPPVSHTAFHVPSISSISPIRLPPIPASLSSTDDL